MNFHPHIISHIVPYLYIRDLFAFASVNKHHFTALVDEKQARRDTFIKELSKKVSFRHLPYKPGAACDAYYEIVVDGFLRIRIEANRIKNHMVELMLTVLPDYQWFDSLCLYHTVKDGVLVPNHRSYTMHMVNKSQIYESDFQQYNFHQPWVLSPAVRPTQVVTFSTHSLCVSLHPSGDCVITFGSMIKPNSFTVSYEGRRGVWNCWGQVLTPTKYGLLHEEDFFFEGEDGDADQIPEWMYNQGMNLYHLRNMTVYVYDK
jgi:hypothetical protein